ncbi:hypothetical protein [Lacinutrix sp. Bg11-31]|uniref:hypothetical protein n=1 Tax=Lacinutrix sp. Bg11-31 TaxID=2057808 RepID=UPI001E2BF420|nr:hypothetical protein [Lacinutrix sp. Bg11-31]
MDGKWILVSKSICDMLGCNEAELLEMTFQEIIIKEDLALDLYEFNNPKYFISQLQDITDRINAIEAQKVLVEIIKEKMS